MTKPMRDAADRATRIAKEHEDDLSRVESQCFADRLDLPRQTLVRARRVFAGEETP